MAATEYTFLSETVAHAERRGMIDEGLKVSLVAYDPQRKVYVFDHINCCDGTGWTGNTYTRCAEHYQPSGWPMTY